MSRTFKVGTFANERGRVTCYTLWFDRSWAGCIEYVVEASNGTEAKKKAKALRIAHEKTGLVAA